MPRRDERGRVAPRIRVKVLYEIALGLTGALLAAAPAAARPAPQVRVDQLGYAPGEAKIAYLLAPRALRNARFRVTDAAGKTVFRGRVGRSRGRWNRRYRAVQSLDLSALRTPGRYRVRVRRARSPRFRIADPAALLRPRVAESVAFFRAQRDTAHRNDAHATVYADPTYDGPDSDVIRGRSLKAIGGPVDATDGWVDAGDFIKFTHTTAYASALLLIARRELGAAAPPQLEPEARFGLAWLDKAWQDDGTMLLQVGIGSGNKAGTFNGDHDVWRLPQKDDGLKGARNRYLRNRPVFRANAPGEPVPPNLAGRVSAAFALAAQLDAATQPDRARAELATAAQIYGAAKTSDVRGRRHRAPARVLPRVLVARRPRARRRGAGARRPARSATRARATGCGSRPVGAAKGEDTLNLYDVSAVAHAELIRAGRELAVPVGEPKLLADLRAQLARGTKRARRDPFGAGMVYDDFDAASHGFGLVATAALYKRLTGDTRYDRFAHRAARLGAGRQPVGRLAGDRRRQPLRALPAARRSPT